MSFSFLSLCSRQDVMLALEPTRPCLPLAVPLLRLLYSKIYLCFQGLA